MGSYVSTVAPAATAAAPPVQPTLIVVGSGLAGLTTALRFLQVRHSSHNEQFHFGHFHFGGLLSLWWFWWFCYLAWLLCALCYQAAKIKDPSKQYKVVILEADSVAGGRTRSTVLDKLPATAPPVSYGGTWVILQDDSLVGLSNEVRHCCARRSALCTTSVLLSGGSHRAGAHTHALTRGIYASYAGRLDAIHADAGTEL